MSNLYYKLSKIGFRVTFEKKSFDSLEKGNGKSSSDNTLEAAEKIKSAMENMKKSSSNMSKKRQKEVEDGLLKCAKRSYDIVNGLIYVNQRMFNVRILRNENFNKYGITKRTSLRYSNRYYSLIIFYFLLRKKANINDVIINIVVGSGTSTCARTFISV